LSAIGAVARLIWSVVWIKKERKGCVVVEWIESFGMRVVVSAGYG
jgi:hypothetical protein